MIVPALDNLLLTLVFSGALDTLTTGQVREINERRLPWRRWCRRGRNDHSD
jgi:hypothetical protein